jgi:hypothetical protein
MATLIEFPFNLSDCETKKLTMLTMLTMLPHCIWIKPLFVPLLLPLTLLSFIFNLLAQQKPPSGLYTIHIPFTKVQMKKNTIPVQVMVALMTCSLLSKARDAVGRKEIVTLTVGRELASSLTSESPVLLP